MRTILLVLLASAPARASPWHHHHHHDPAQAPPPEPAFGIGVHKTGQALGVGHHDDVDEEEPTKMRGGGVHVRWRFAPRFSVELALDRLATRGDDQVVEREAKVGSASLAFHPRPSRRVDLYVLCGVGRRVDEYEVRTEAGMVTADRKRAQFHVGAGVEKRFRRLAVGAEVRLVGLRERDDDDAGAERTPRVPMPTEVTSTEDERGAQLTIGLTWYFGRAL